MGNCTGIQRPAVACVDDDDFWGAMEEDNSGYRGKHKDDDDDDTKLLLPAPRKETDKAGACSSEIKIRIRKRQLEELLARADGGSQDQLPLILADLVTAGESVKLHEPEGHWRPRLQSIPELPESNTNSLYMDE